VTRAAVGWGAGAVVLLLAGCQFTSGIFREAMLDARLDPACAEGAIKSIEGLTVTASYPRETRTFQVAPESGAKIWRSVAFVYDAPDVSQIWFAVTTEEKAEKSSVTHTWGQQNKQEMTEERLAAALRAMLKVEAAVKERCGVRFETKMKCAQVDCGKLEAIEAGEGA
jgi:hypothetical protein